MAETLGNRLEHRAATEAARALALAGKMHVTRVQIERILLQIWPNMNEYARRRAIREGIVLGYWESINWKDFLLTKASSELARDPEGVGESGRVDAR